MCFSSIFCNDFRLVHIQQTRIFLVVIFMTIKSWIHVNFYYALIVKIRGSILKRARDVLRNEIPRIYLRIWKSSYFHYLERDFDLVCENVMWQFIPIWRHLCFHFFWNGAIRSISKNNFLMFDSASQRQRFPPSAHETGSPGLEPFQTYFCGNSLHYTVISSLES